jgi:hypothetical protein
LRLRPLRRAGYYRDYKKGVTESDSRGGVAAGQAATDLPLVPARTIEAVAVEHSIDRETI